MPELPEVETIRADLARKLVGRRIKSVEILNPKTVAPAPAIFYKSLAGERIKMVNRRAKLLFLELQPSQKFLLIHLKMTGQLIYQDKKGTVAGGHSDSAEAAAIYPNRHTRVLIVFSDNSRLFFNDLRKFGYMKLVTRAELGKFISRSYGPEPLTKDFSLDALAAILKSKKTNLKAALLNQKNIAGLGNIYVDEALFAARLDPRRQASSLRAAEIKALYSAINKIIKAAIRWRGTTFNNYRDSEGRRGNFSRYLQVYGRQNELCLNCRQPLQKIKLAGRGTYYCPHCQV